MPPEKVSAQSAAAKREGIPTREANFYALPFASQMIVWAVRKRLHVLSGADCAMDDVLHVFHLASWGELYGALLAVADVLASAAARVRLQMHAVGCPCLARHEVHLLNALAYLQSARLDEAVLCLVECLPPSDVRLTLPHLQLIADALRKQAMSFAYVVLPGIESPSPELLPASRGIGHVH
jgi:hypothetical protein